MITSSNALHDLKSLSSAQKTALRKNNFKEASDLILTPPSDFSKRLKISLSEAQLIVESVCKELAPNVAQLQRLGDGGNDKFTTGDASLDEAIGGGIRTGMVWELSGESASGKTQLALQLSLLVQVRPILGGLFGAACYLTTHSKLPTMRLAQLAEKHPLLSSSVCSLSDVHTLTVPTIDLLAHTLKVTLQALQHDLCNDPTRKPIRLVVIDSVSTLFHTNEKPSTTTLIERSKALSDLSRVMHTIANRDGVAFVVINEVTDVFSDFHSYNQEGVSKSDVVYRDQARWFGSAHSMPRENSKEAGLGLVWANQLNARIMLTRTNRRRYLDGALPLSKRRRVGKGALGSTQPSSSTDTGVDVDQAVLIRRLSVVFSSVSALNFVDFIITREGVSVVADEMTTDTSVASNPRNGLAATSAEQGAGVANPQPDKPAISSLDGSDLPTTQLLVPARVAEIEASDPLDGPPIARGEPEVIPSSYPGETDEMEDGGLYWEEFDKVPYDTLCDIGLDKANVEEDIRA